MGWQGHNTVQEQELKLFSHYNDEVSSRLNTSVIILKQSIGDELTRPVVLNLWVATPQASHI